MSPEELDRLSLPLDQPKQFQNQQSQPQYSPEEIQQNVLGHLDRLAIPIKQEKSFTEALPRHIARTGARAVEAIGGSYGNLQQTVGQGISSIAEGIRGKELPQMRQMAEENRDLATSPEIKEKISSLTNKYTEAQTPGEESYDEVVSDIADFVNPLMPFNKGKVGWKLGKGAINALAGQAGKYVAKFAGADESDQMKAKIATQVVSSLVSGWKSARTYKDEQYALAEKFLPKNASINIATQRNNLENLKTELLKGLGEENPAKAKIIAAIRKVESKIATNGDINIDELLPLRQDLNSIKYSKDLHGVEKLINPVVHNIDEGLKKYGSANPKWYKPWSNGNAAHKGLQQSRKISNTLLPLAEKYPKMSAGTLALYGLVHAPSAGAIATGVAGIKALEFGHRLLMSPTLRNLYIKSLAQASAGNSGAAMRSALALDKKLKDEGLVKK